MKNQALFSSNDKSKKVKCRLLQILFGALRVKYREDVSLRSLSIFSCKSEDFWNILSQTGTGCSKYRQLNMLVKMSTR